MITERINRYMSQLGQQFSEIREPMLLFNELIHARIVQFLVSEHIYVRGLLQSIDLSIGRMLQVLSRPGLHPILRHRAEFTDLRERYIGLRTQLRAQTIARP